MAKRGVFIQRKAQAEADYAPWRTCEHVLLDKAEIPHISSVVISTMIPTRIEFHVLVTLLDGPRHGYGIMLDVGELTSGQLRLGPGTLYSAIRRLLQAGLIEECEPDAERRRCYRLTRKGKTTASEEAQRLSDLVRLARKRGLLPSAS